MNGKIKFTTKWIAYVAVMTALVVATNFIPAIPTPAGCTNDCPGGTGAAYFPPVPAMPSTN